MSWMFRRAGALALIPVICGGVVSCKKRNEVAASELKDAGYEMTAEDWFRASREDNVEVLKKYISGGFSVGEKGRDGVTALHEAAIADARESADFLLDRGLPIDVTDDHDRTPLMAAVMADQSEMVAWLLRQGASAELKDEGGFLPIMIAAREGSSGSISELAPYSRENLDAALLLASLDGNSRSIDALTNYGASVYATMSDGRTPLMLAAENGHREAVALLLDIGSSRYSVDSEGRTAMDLAELAGFPEISEAILNQVDPVNLSLESTEQLAAVMEESLDQAIDGPVEAMDQRTSSANPAVAGNDIPAGATGMQAPTGSAVSDSPLQSAAARATRPVVVSLEGAVISSPRVIRVPVAARGNSAEISDEETPAPAASAAENRPLIMRTYRQTVLPIEVKSVSGNTATLRVSSNPPREIEVQAGEQIPESSLVIVKVLTRTEDSKFTGGVPVQVPVVQVQDQKTGETREWKSGLPVTSHDPVALVEDGVTGARFTAMPGQHFSSADGTEYTVADVRPNQIVIEEVATGQVETIRLSGPRG